MPRPGQYPWMVFNPWVFANYGAPHTTRQRGYVSPIVYQTHQPRLSRILSSGTWAQLGATQMPKIVGPRLAPRLTVRRVKPPVSRVPTTFYVPRPAPTGPVRIPGWTRSVFGRPPGMPGLGRMRLPAVQTTFYSPVKVNPLPEPSRVRWPRRGILGQYAPPAGVGIVGGILGLALSVYMIWNMVKIRQAVEKTAGVRRNRRRRRARRRRR